MEGKSDSGLGHSIMSGQEAPTLQHGQPDSWTLFREGVVQPLFALQKHMPEITVGRSTDCTLSCPGGLNRNQGRFKGINHIWFSGTFLFEYLSIL